MVIEITDLQAPELDVYARLNENQLLNRAEPEKGMFIAESPKVIERALDAGCVPVSILMEKKHVEGEGKVILERCGDIPVYVAAFEVLTQLTGFQLTRGMLCAMLRPPLRTVEELCINANRIAVLENVMNPTNVGAIFRSAAAMHMDAVILCGNCSNPLYRRAIRVSMGTVFQIPWAIWEIEEACEDFLVMQLKKHGFRTAALALTDQSVSIEDETLMSEEKLAVFLGNEGEGLDERTIASCDYTVKIPMSHGVDSLNVAAASAVAFWQLRKK